MSHDEVPDKQNLYGRYYESENWRQKLHKKLTHKSLDIPEDDDVFVDNSRKGLGWKELAVIAGTLLGGGYLLNQNQQPPSVPAAVSPVDSEYEVRFFDRDGHPITVPHIKTRPEG